ncbi:MAG TPA: DUF2231 domain-containing protein [Candidatus Limnocylindria bacterium]
MKLKHPVVYGHPLHAMASDLPVALIPTALLAAAADRARPSSSTRLASDAASVLALGAATAAASLGWWDWLTIPSGHPVRRPATIHGLINTSGLALGALALADRRRRFGLLLAINASLLVAAWIGGDLVYALGWRVRPAEELEQLDEGRTREEARRIVDEHERKDLLLTTTR